MSTTLTELLPPVAVVPGGAPYPDLSEEIILQRLATHWMPREILPAEQWLYQNLRLEKNMTSEFAGEPYDIRNVPHARLIFDFLRDPVAEELNVMKSSAAAMSTAVIAAITYYFWLDPRNIIYLISNQDEARKLSKQVMQPFLRQVFGTNSQPSGRPSFSRSRCTVLSLTACGSTLATTNTVSDLPESVCSAARCLE